MSSKQYTHCIQYYHISYIRSHTLTVRLKCFAFLCGKQFHLSVYYTEDPGKSPVVK